MKIKITRDKYQKKRGKPVLYKIFCAKCLTPLCIYQKDGPGPLLRMYADRIHVQLIDPQNLEGAQKISDLVTIKCTCNNIVAHPMIYEPENRLAFRMIHGSFGKIKYKN